LKNEKMLRGYARPRPAASQDGGKVGFFKKKNCRQSQWCRGYYFAKKPWQP
jgi:hypothetical protein